MKLHGLAAGEEDGAVSTAEREFIEEVRRGLSLPPGRRELPTSYLYDDVGSGLFEVICALPEYGLSRASERLFARHSRALAARLAPPVRIVDLGSGNGRKTRPLLEALAAAGPVTYCPIDRSSRALERAALEIAGIAGVGFSALPSGYLEGLEAAAGARAAEERLLVMFLGGTIGNFDRPDAEAFLGQVASQLGPGDLFLLETDLLKPVPTLLRAYDDPLGVTAAFNLNLLRRVNAELGADFDVARFRHEARWNEPERRIEMHLRSIADQAVQVAAAGLRLSLARDETIWTENSHRFDRAEVAAMGRRQGLRCLEQIEDEEWPFAQTLFARDA